MKELTERAIEFIRQHAMDDPDRIRLNGKSVDNFSAGFLADQIEARRGQQDRLPSFFAEPKIIFPPSLNLEQSSSEITASLKAEYISSTGSPCNRLIDLTLGTGVDTLAFTRIFKKIYCVEPDAILLNITRHNLLILSATDLEFFNQTAEKFLQNQSITADWIFIDPSRRDLNKRVVRLQDSIPNVLELKNSLLSIAGEVLIKTSPMLDISSVLKKWDSVVSIIIISVKNDCREVLYHLSHLQVTEPKIICLNVTTPGNVQRFEFLKNEEAANAARYSKPLQYIYEPNAAILKAGAFRLICNRFPVFKLAVSTHLYTSENLVPNFPGRVFRIISRLDKKEKNFKANVISRNHPLSAPQIREKYAIRDGGNDYVIAFSSIEGKHTLITKKI